MFFFKLQGNLEVKAALSRVCPQPKNSYDDCEKDPRVGGAFFRVKESHPARACTVTRSNAAEGKKRWWQNGREASGKKTRVGGGIHSSSRVVLL